MWSLSHGGAGAKRTANHTAIWALQARFSGNQGMWPGRNLPSSCDLSSFSKACATAGLELSCAGCAVMPAAYRSLGFTPCCCCSAGTWANQSTARSRGVHGEMCVLIHRNTQKLTVTKGERVTSVLEHVCSTSPLHTCTSDMQLNEEN